MKIFKTRRKVLLIHCLACWLYLLTSGGRETFKTAKNDGQNYNKPQSSSRRISTTAVCVKEIITYMYIHSILQCGTKNNQRDLLSSSSLNLVSKIHLSSRSYNDKQGNWYMIVPVLCKMGFCPFFILSQPTCLQDAIINAFTCRLQARLYKGKFHKMYNTACRSNKYIILDFFACKNIVKNILS